MIKKSDLTEVSFIEWDTPLSITKTVSGLGFFVSGRRTTLTTDANYTKVDFIDWDLQVVKTLARSENNISLTRRVLEKDGKVFIINDKGVIIKVDFLTNTLEAETQSPEEVLSRSFKLIGDKILMMTASGKIYMYNTNLVLLYTWDFYPTGTGTTGDLENDLNNTVWVTHAKNPTVLFKKQFIDLTKGAI